MNREEKQIIDFVSEEIEASYFESMVEKYFEKYHNDEHIINYKEAFDDTCWFISDKFSELLKLLQIKPRTIERENAQSGDLIFVEDDIYMVFEARTDLSYIINLKTNEWVDYEPNSQKVIDNYFGDEEVKTLRFSIFDLLKLLGEINENNN